MCVYIQIYIYVHIYTHIYVLYAYNNAHNGARTAGLGQAAAMMPLLEILAK